MQNSDISCQREQLVSIITPTYNCGSFITATIQSVIAQTYQNWEMIIADDCSTDGTYEVIEPYLKDNRIKYFCNERNSGAAITRNNALKLVSGHWVAFLDSDDLWLPEKLERQIGFMEANGYAFTYHQYVEIDEHGDELGILVSGKRRVKKFDMYACCWPGCLSVIYDVSKIGLVQVADVKKNNDTAMWFKVIKKSDCFLLHDILGQYRRRTNSITPKPIWKRIWAHYPLFRKAEGMNPLASILFTLVNVFGNAYKKLFYVKKYEL